MIRTPTGKTLHFGDSKEEDYTTTQDAERKEKYIKRHHVVENWNNWETADFWSYWLLWNKPTVDESIKDVETRFGYKIIPIAMAKN